jgi:hypothetical protein
MARCHARGSVEGARAGYRTARTELAGAVPPHALGAVLAAYRAEGTRLAATARAAGLVEHALRRPPAPGPGAGPGSPPQHARQAARQPGPRTRAGGA